MSYFIILWSPSLFMFLELSLPEPSEIEARRTRGDLSSGRSGAAWFIVAGLLGCYRSAVRWEAGGTITTIAHFSNIDHIWRNLFGHSSLFFVWLPRWGSDFIWDLLWDLDVTYSLSNLMHFIFIFFHNIGYTWRNPFWHTLYKLTICIHYHGGIWMCMGFF